MTGRRQLRSVSADEAGGEQPLWDGPTDRGRQLMAEARRRLLEAPDWRRDLDDRG